MATKIAKEAADAKLQAAKGELQAAKGELQAVKGELRAAVNASDDVMKGILLKQAESCNKQIESWGERVSDLLKQISSLEAPAGSTSRSLACL